MNRIKEAVISSLEGSFIISYTLCPNMSAARYFRTRDLVLAISSVRRTIRELARSILVMLPRKISRSSRASLISCKEPLPNLRSIWKYLCCWSWTQGAPLSIRLLFPTYKSNNYDKLIKVKIKKAYEYIPMINHERLISFMMAASSCTSPMCDILITPYLSFFW